MLWVDIALCTVHLKAMAGQEVGKASYRRRFGGLNVPFLGMVKTGHLQRLER